MGDITAVAALDNGGTFRQFKLNPVARIYLGKLGKAE